MWLAWERPWKQAHQRALTRVEIPIIQSGGGSVSASKLTGTLFSPDYESLSVAHDRLCDDGPTILKLSLFGSTLVYDH